ncbi:MAG: TonB-dependent receptor, partial [Mucilaginibacter sp.]
DKPGYTIRQKVKFKLNPKDKDGKPVTGSFSVAVTDETKVPVDSLNENSILTNLLLTSDLKGNIEQPGYYFTGTDEKTRTDLDNLMLTQGYRQFEWKKVLADTTAPAVYQPEKTMQVSGTVKRNGKPVPNAQIKLFSKAGGMFMLDTLTDANGKFAFKGLIFADSTKFVVQSRVKKGQDDVTLELDTTRLTIKSYSAGQYVQANVSVADISAYLINQKQFYEEQQKYGINKHALVLKEVKVEAKKEPLIPHSENLNGAGNADQVLTAKDIERFICGRLSDCLIGVLNGITFKNGVPQVGALVIDGTFVDVETFLDLRPDDIEGIEVIRRAHYGAIYGSRMANGGLIITTKRAKKLNEFYRYAPGVVTYMPKGFYKAREFYSPQYDNPHTNQKMADLRSTIYWNPNIITDKDGKASFEYFNADGKGTYRVVVEGIDADGNLGRQVFRYKVE